MSVAIIVIGGGGHARVLVDALYCQGVTVLGFTDAEPEKARQAILEVRCLGGDDAVLQFKPNEVQLINGLGSVRETSRRQRLFDSFKKMGYTFFSVIHPSAVVAKDVKLGEGAQIMAGAVIQTGSYIGMNTIVNTKASVDHDCVLGEHVHLAPGVTLSGEVKIGTGVHVGTGATIIHGIDIGRNSLIGAGSLVIRDVPENATVLGVPARVVATRFS